MAKKLTTYWVPFSQTSTHHSMQKLWPIFVLDEAAKVVKPLMTLILATVKKIDETECKAALRELQQQKFYVDDVQLTKLVSMLNKK